MTSNGHLCRNEGPDLERAEPRRAPPRHQAPSLPDASVPGSAAASAAAATPAAPAVDSEIEDRNREAPKIRVATREVPTPPATAVPNAFPKAALDDPHAVGGEPG